MKCVVEPGGHELAQIWCLPADKDDGIRGEDADECSLPDGQRRPFMFEQVPSLPPLLADELLVE